ncbi:MAG: hypothetical protein KDC23_13095 [Actinobacteria bacterium]|nr:hypothetical protein [Actinomycetota bacterium]
MKSSNQLKRAVFGFVLCISLIASGCSSATLRPSPSASLESNNTPEMTPSAVEADVGTYARDADGTNESNIVNDNISLTQDETFSLSSASNTIPEDILPEIRFFSGGAGGGSICEHNQQQYGAFVLDRILLGTKALELGHQVKIGLCGGPKKDTDVVIELPTGEVRHATAQYWGETNAASEALLVFYTSIDDPPGTYIFDFPELPTPSQLRLSIEAPTGPRLLLDHHEQQIRLYNFSPNELVRLVAYMPSQDSNEIDMLMVAGWQQYQLDSRGQLIIDVSSVDQMSLTYAAIGNISGVAEGYGIFDPEGLLFGLLIETDVLASSANDELGSLPCESIVINDDFADVNSGWEKEWINPYSGSANGYREGAYYFRAVIPNAPMWYVLERTFDLRQATIQIDATTASGSGEFGFILDFRGDYLNLDNAAYQLVTVATGDASASYANTEGIRHIRSYSSDLNWAEGLKTVGIRIVGSNLKAYVDSVLVLDMEVNEMNRGEVGFYVAASNDDAPFEVILDNFRVCE